MKARTLLTTFASVTVLSGLISCGGGGSGGGVAGIGGTGMTVGAVTGFGSIFVNGVEFETTNATIEADDSSAAESDLRIGMVVTVEGTVNADGVTGTAARVIYDDDIEGPVAALTENADQNQKTFQIFGTTVVVDSTGTNFDSTTYGGVADNRILEVSGFFDGTGVLQATRVEDKGAFNPGVTTAELKGTVSGLGLTTFELQGVTVDYSGANLSDVTGGMLANGMFVEAEGVLNAATTMTATRVQEEDEGFDDDVDEFSLEGIVSDFVSLSDFKVSGQPVDASGADFEPASLATGLSDGMKVEVEGAIAGGLLIAEEVKAESGEVKLHAELSASDEAAGTFTVAFPNVAGNITVKVNSGTEVDDEVGDLDSVNDLFTLAAGAFLEIEGYEDAGNTVVATEVKREIPDKYVVQGAVDSTVPNTQIEILGVMFFTDGSTDYEDNSDSDVGQGPFYAGLNIGDVVRLVDNDGDGFIDEADYED